MRVSIISPDDALQPLADTITQHLIPALINQPVLCKAMRDLLALPSRLGGMGLVNPAKWGTSQQATSLAVSQPLSQMIIGQGGDMLTVTKAQRTIKAHFLWQQRAQQKIEAENVISQQPKIQRKSSSCSGQRLIRVACCHTSHTLRF